MAEAVFNIQISVNRSGNRAHLVPITGTGRPQQIGAVRIPIYYYQSVENRTADVMLPPRSQAAGGAMA